MKKYYIGDLAYVISDAAWVEFCDLTIVGNQCLNGTFVTSSGVKTSHHSTYYGDGSYYDQHGNVYDVDSGTLGVICLDDISGDNITCQGGHIHKFEKFPYLTYNNGTFIFTDGTKIVRIETNVDEEDEDMS